MLSMEHFRTVAGRRLLGRDGERIGTIDELYADSEGGSPTFVTVETGLFGTNTTFVPVADASMQGDDLVVPYTKDQVKDAPNVAPDGELSVEEEDRLYAHYGLGTGHAQADTDTAGGADGATARGGTGAGPATDAAMTRSEEQLRVGTREVEAGRARLRKYVVAEDVTETVAVGREELRVEREPLTEADLGALDGLTISEEEHEIVLTEERPVVQKETVPVERIRLDKETVTEKVTVDETVRREQVELDGGARPGSR